MIENIGGTKAASRGQGERPSGPAVEERAADRANGGQIVASPAGAPQRGSREHAERWGEEVLAIDLSPLRYLRDLLALGVKRARDPRLPLETLRTQRIGAGIDLAELDTVPLWASQRVDGSIALPFLELVLDEVLTRADRVLQTCAQLTHGSGAAARITALEIAALRRQIVESARIDPESAHSFPYLPLEEVARVCAHGGAVTRLVEQCQQIRAEALARCRNIADLTPGSARQ